MKHYLIINILSYISNVTIVNLLERKDTMVKIVILLMVLKLKLHFPWTLLFSRRTHSSKISKIPNIWRFFLFNIFEVTFTTAFSSSHLLLQEIKKALDLFFHWKNSSPLPVLCYKVMMISSKSGVRSAYQTFMVLLVCNDNKVLKLRFWCLF